MQPAVGEGLLDDAVAACRSAVALKPSYAEGYNSLGAALAARGKLDEAIEAYRTLAAQRPGSAERYQKRLAELEELKKNAAGTR